MGEGFGPPLPLTYATMIWRFVVGLLAVLVLIFAIGFVSTGLNLAQYRFWAPQQEDARRTVYEESASYVHGKRQYLTRLHLEWSRATNDGTRSVLCTTARHEASTLSERHYPDHLTDWECIR
jgi:hypothetical protein